MSTLCYGCINEVWGAMCQRVGRWDDEVRCGAIGCDVRCDVNVLEED